jgi:hypothetical protein
MELAAASQELLFETGRGWIVKHGEHLFPVRERGATLG